MYHTPAAGTLYDRVTSRDMRRTDLLTGMGSYFDTGGRYNRTQQRTVYASDDPLVSLTEMAFYRALDWREQIGGGDPAAPAPQPKPSPPTFPFVSDHTLWCFFLKNPPHVIDVDDPAAYLLFQHDPIVLLNPGQFYETTEALADRIRAHVHPPHSRPQGIKAPSARTPSSPEYQPCQYALFVFGRRLAGQIAWRADLTLEFLDPDGQPVSRATRRVDWAHPRFKLEGLADPVPAFAPRPGAQAYQPGPWYRFEVVF
jgi:hypothetical protein